MDAKEQRLLIRFGKTNLIFSVGNFIYSGTFLVFVVFLSSKKVL